VASATYLARRRVTDDIADVFSNRLGVCSLRFKTETSTSPLYGLQTKMLYKAGTGTTDPENYGIRLAKAMKFPPRFIKVAERAAKRLHDLRVVREQDPVSVRIYDRRKLLLNLQTALRELLESGKITSETSGYLSLLRSQFINHFSAYGRLEKNLDESVGGQISSSRTSNYQE